MSQNITNYIGKISETIKDIESSISTINIGNIGENEDFLVYKETYKKIKSLNDNTENIISFLFDSVLIGEYLDKDIDKQLKQIRNNLTYTENIESSIPKEDKYKPILSLIEPLKNKTSEIQNIINYYLLFIEDVKTIVSNPEKDEIFILSKSKYQSVNDSETLKLFTLNLSLCFSDILFTEKQDCYQEITYVKELLSEERFSNLNPNPQIEKMKKKATFLLFKWCKRAKLSGFSMLKEDKIKEYKDDINNFGDKWKDWVTYIENHYYKEEENSLFVGKIKKSYAEIKDKDFEDFTCQDIHLYIKYHKDINKNTSKLDNIISYLKDWKKKGTDDYEKSIRNIIYNYALNNRFSLFTKTCKSREKLYEEYEKIEEKDNKNYFLQYKLIDKSIELLKAELNEKNNTITIEQIEEIENYLDKIEPAYKTYKTNIEWILEHIYFIYRVSFKECIIDDIFIYSSFLLPLGNRKSKEDYERINDDFRVLKSQIDPLKRIVQFDEKIEKRDTKTIELMGLFSAIIAFVMGSIPTFQYMKNIYDVGIFFVVFATSLISFLLVLLFITGRIKVNKEQKWWESPIVYFLFFYIAMIIIAYVLSCFNPKDNERKTTTLQQTEKTIIEEKITSNKTVDTLKQSKITKKHTTSTKDSLK